MTDKKKGGEFLGLVFLAALVLISIVCTFVQKAYAQNDKWQDTMIVFVCRELDESDAAMARIEEAQARMARDVAWLQGWLYAAVGVPTVWAAVFGVGKLKERRKRDEG